MRVGTLLSRNRPRFCALALLGFALFGFALLIAPLEARAVGAPPRAQLDDGDWSLLVPQSTPDPQEAQGGIFDAPRNRVLIFGGWDGTNSLNTTRELTIGAPPTWGVVATLGTRPAGRYAHSVVYDSARDRILVFGGRDASSSYFGDVWALTLSGPPTWTQILPSGTPPSGRFGHEAIYDPIRDRMLVFGGYDGVFCNDLWELSLGGTPTWTQLTPAGTPPTERDFATSAYDPVGDRIVLYGGNVYVSPGPPTASGDVWTLSLSGTPTWAPLAVTGSPPVSRLLHKSFYDAPRNRLIVMGGYDGFNFRNDAYA
ncbi:MAG: kelch repeat-containing protein, partial [Candidatus Eisenbacteria bacterium]